MTANLSSAERYQHQYYMSRAIELAKKGRFTTRPNPNVGCVIVKDNQIIGEGFHYQAGQPHAEVFALRQAYERDAKHLQGATLDWVRELLLDPSQDRGLFKPAMLDRLLTDPQGQLTPLRGSKLWQLAALNLWLSEQGI